MNCPSYSYHSSPFISAHKNAYLFIVNKKRVYKEHFHVDKTIEVYYSNKNLTNQRMPYYCQIDVAKKSQRDIEEMLVFVASI
jgi:hypothetical protein